MCILGVLGCKQENITSGIPEGEKHVFWQPIWEFPKTRGTFWGFPIIRIIVSGADMGVPLFWETTISLPKAPRVTLSSDSRPYHRMAQNLRTPFDISIASEHILMRPLCKSHRRSAHCSALIAASLAY